MRIDNIMLAALALLLLSITVGGALAAQLPDQNSPRNITFTDNSGVKNAFIVQFSDGTSATSWSSYITSSALSTYQALVHANFTSLFAADSALTTRVNTVNASALATDARVTTINSTYQLADSALTTRVNTVNTTVQNLLTSNTSTGSTIGGLYTNVTALQNAPSSGGNLSSANGSVGYLARFTNGTNTNTGTVLDVSNLIGIGVVPTSKLDVGGNISVRLAANDIARFTDGSNASAIAGTNGKLVSSGGNFVIASSASSNSITFSTAAGVATMGLGTERMRINGTDGRISINTTVPVATLTVQGVTNTTRLDTAEICLSGNCTSTWPAGGSSFDPTSLQQNDTYLNASINAVNTRVTTINSSLVGNQTVLYANITSLQSSNNTTQYRIDGALQKARISSGAWNATSDVTGNGYGLTQYGAVVYDPVNEWFNWGGSLDANVDTVNLSAPVTGFTSTGSTVAMWVYTNTSTHRSRLLSANLFATFYYDASSTSIVWFCGNGTSYSTGTTASNAVSYNAWQHYAITNDGTTCSFWRNGAVISTQASVGIGNMSSANPTFNIGGGGASDGHNGSIDDVRVYNRSLNLADMQQLANNGSVMTDLKAWWPFTTTVSFGQYQNITALQAAGGGTNYQNVTDLQTSNTSTNARIDSLNSTKGNVTSSNGSSSYVPRFTSATNIATGSLQDNGTAAGVGMTPLNGATLSVNGNIYVPTNSGLALGNLNNNSNVTLINSGTNGASLRITASSGTFISSNTQVGATTGTLTSMFTVIGTSNVTGNATFGSNVSVFGNVTVSQNLTTSGTLTTPGICLNGDCKTAWPTGGGSGGGTMDYWTLTNESSGSTNNVNITNGSTVRLSGTGGIVATRTVDDIAFSLDSTVLTTTSLATGLINTTLLNTTNSPVTGYVPSYNGSGDQFTWIPAGTGGGGTIDGTGRAGAYAQWTDTDSLNSSGIFQNGSVFLVGNATSDNGAVYYQTMEVSGSGKRTYLTINDNTGEGASLHLRSLTEDFDILNNGTHLRFQYENRSFVNMSGITGEIRFNNTLYVNDGTVLTNTTITTGLINSSLLDSVDSPAAGEVLSYAGAGQFEWVPDATGGGGSVTGLTSNGTKFGFNSGTVPNATLEIRPDGPLTTIENQSMYALMLKRVADNNGGAIGLGFVDSSSTTGQQVGASWIYTREGSNGYGNLSAYTKASGGALTYRMGLASNGSVLIPGLVSCDTINTDASGMLYCGSDATGGGGFTYSDYFDQTLNRSSVINASRFSAALGSIASPAITTNLNNDSGIFFLSDGTTGFSNDGAKTFQCNADGCQVPSGSAVFPGLQSTGDDDTGIFYKAGNVLGITAGGNVGGGEVANFSDQGVGVTALCLYPDSNPMMPCRGFHSDPEAARRYMTTDIDTFVVGGAETGEYGTWGWITNTLPTGGDVTSTATTFDVKSMGVLSLGSGTVTGSNVSISTDTSTSAGFWINGSSGINAFYTRVAADLTGHTANNYTTMVGFTDVQDKRIGVDAVIAMYNSSESVNWILATCNTNVCSKNTSSVRWGNSSFADIEVQVWNNTQALMFINGTLAATLHSNLPSGSGDLMWAGSIRHGNTNGTTESRLYIDYYGVAKVFNEVRY